MTVLLFSASVAQANDSAIVGVGGGFRPLKGEHKSVQMVQESVRIDVWSRSNYQTTVDFVFHNHGPAQTVQMGFPESGQGDIAPADYRTKSAFKQFTTWVDGRRVPVKRVSQDRPIQEGSYQALWVKSVPFRAGQKRRIRVRYQSGTGMRASEFKEGGLRFVSYHFTGGNWHDDVEKSTLTVHLHPQAARIIDINSGQTKPANIRRNARLARLFWTNWPAESFFDLSFVAPKRKN